MVRIVRTGLVCMVATACVCGGATILNFNWEGAASPLGELACRLQSGSASDVSIELAWDHRCLRIRNPKGENRILKIATPGLPTRSVYTVQIEAGVKAASTDSKAWLLFLQQGKAFDLRVNAGNIYLMKKGIEPVRLGSYTPGKLLSVALQVDPLKHVVTKAVVDGREVAGFEPVPFLAPKSISGLTIFGSTPSDQAIYIKSIRVEAEKAETASLWMQKPVKTVPEAQETDIYQGPKASAPVYRLNADKLAANTLGDNFFFSGEQLRRLPELVKNDSSLQTYLNTLFEYCEPIVQNGGIEFKVTSAQRHIYALYGILPKFALAYLLTGEEQTGRLLKELVLHTARQPLSFWIHHHLRKFDPAFPVGQLETGNLTLGLSMAYAWNKELFSAAEQGEIEEALRHKGLYPCLRWCETSQMKSNFICIIAGGALSAALALEEEAAADTAKTKLASWLDLLEDDGSYAEPIGYFSYGLQHFVSGALALGSEEATNLVRDSRLRGSLNYLMGAYSYNDHSTLKSAEGTTYASRCVNFGDDDFIGSPDRTCFHFLANVFDQSQALWMLDTFYGKDDTCRFMPFIMKLMYADRKPTPTPPATLDMPACKAYDSGFGLIRSSWTMDRDTVLALRSGAGGKVNYVHDMPNRNSIVLFVNGVYLLNATGRASYRNPRHFSYNNATVNHNTITFGDVTQVNKGQAHFTACQETDDLCFLASDATGSYKIGPFKATKAHRSILYMKDPGYFVMVDQAAGSNKSNVDWNMHFANFDGKSVFQQTSPDALLFKRGGIDLHMTVVCDQPVVWRKQDDAIMHTGYSYYPGDPKEGRRGSAIKLQVSTEEVTDRATFVTFFYPQTGNKPELKVALNPGSETSTVEVIGEGIRDVFTFADTVSVTRQRTGRKPKTIRLTP